MLSIAMVSRISWNSFIHLCLDLTGHLPWHIWVFTYPSHEVWHSIRSTEDVHF